MTNGAGYYIVDPKDVEAWGRGGLYLHAIKPVDMSLTSNKDAWVVIWYHRDGTPRPSGSYDNTSTWCLDSPPKLIPCIPPWLVVKVDEGL